MTAPLSRLLDGWRSAPTPDLDGVWAVAHPGRAFAIAGMVSQLERTALVVVPGERDAGDLVDDLELFLDDVVLAPAWETLPFEHVSPNIGTMAGRARARDRLLKPGRTGVVVASVRSAIQRLSPSPFSPIAIGTGDTVDLAELASSLARLGYARTDRVEARGEFAVRGGIVDVFPAQADEPVRVDFWGDEIEEIRGFSVSTQRSEDERKDLVIYPARELRPDPAVVHRARGLLKSAPWAASTWERFTQEQLFPGIESWLPWVSDEVSLIDEAGRDVLLIVVDPARARDRARDLREEEGDLAAALAPTWGEASPVAGEHPMLFLDLESSLARPHLSMPSAPTSPSDPVLEVRGFDAIAGDPASVASGVNRLLGRGTTAVIAMDGAAAADRVARLLLEHGLALERLDRLENRRPAVIPVGIHRGFVSVEPAVAVLGEQEIAGRRRAHRRVGRSRAAAQPQYRDLVEGDYVVHHQHGIGRFEGLVTRSMMGIERDYLVVGYAGEDRLYVPVDQLAAVKKYTGGEAPRVSRMGGKDWSDQKTRVRKAVAAVAQEVVELHRQRARATGHAYDVDTPWQSEMEASFPFEETVDQDRAIAEVKQDMESEKPMDRLVFGDVGFGKTEVAIRAAFKAIQSGSQVAVLCPTTLLAQQHHQTFGGRFAPYPIRVEQLSRFLTQRQQREVVRGLETGEVDLVIGTHRLLSDDIEFKSLGLLVIDEEQRFGVAAKDAIKRLKVGVDVLTLTATPIPRTLEMALTGIRDVSHIRTPPEDRHPILTYVGPIEEQAISAAIRREILREGQVFYVHNRVQSIDRAVARLEELVPDARFVVAHGQLSEGQLEQVMIDFWNGDYDVMVSTTIIESGLDLPKVNTLIVERADLLGLAQIYQLRGRVGRSDQRAYAYLFHPADQSLTEDAHRRLEAIGEATDLGSGFQLAIRDLEIRGAGSILGEVQTGHISAVGFDLYAELVAEAVDELEGRHTTESKPPEVRIDLPVDAHLPDEYVADQELRLEAYRRLAGTSSHEEVDDVVAEWVDRYGPMPEEAETLARIARLRVEAMRVGLEEIVKLRYEVRMGPVDLKPSQEVRLQRLQPRSVLRAAEGVLFIPAPDPIVPGLIDFVREMWDT